MLWNLLNQKFSKGLITDSWLAESVKLINFSKVTFNV